MDYLPLFFDLRGSPVLLVGGGRVALRKARLLLKAGARLSVVAPEIEDALLQMLDDAAGEYIQAQYQSGHLEGFRLVISATADRKVNESVAADAATRYLPVNIVDQPDLCTFIFPSIIDRSPLMIGVSSGGRSPVLVRRIRSQIEALVPAAYGRLTEFAGRFRPRMAAITRDERDRRKFWEQVIDGPIGQHVLAGRDAEATQMMEECLRLPVEPASGEVYLIGAGPGDPDLLTFKAARLLQKADVVLYDRLVSSRIVDMARRDAERIYVGKKRADHAVPQQEINQLLVELAQQGNCVVRLKGGDPFIFGRGGEEIELLAQNRIPFQVVPGVTAASGCACYAGIPLTHRDHAQSVRFVTGHLKDGSLDLPWSELVGSSQTVVFYMGLQGLQTICEQLQAHGRAAETPIALVEQGTTANQRTLTGTLSTMAEVVAGQSVHAPTLIIVGEVVNLQAQLQWFVEAETPGSWPS